MGQPRNDETKPTPRESTASRQEKKAEPTQTQLDKERADGEGMAPAPEQAPRKH